MEERCQEAVDEEYYGEQLAAMLRGPLQLSTSHLRPLTAAWDHVLLCARAEVYSHTA